MSYQEKYDATTPKEEIGHVEYEEQSSHDDSLAKLGVQTLRDGDVSWLLLFLFLLEGETAGDLLRSVQRRSSVAPPQHTLTQTEKIQVRNAAYAAATANGAIPRWSKASLHLYFACFT